MSPSGRSYQFGTMTSSSSSSATRHDIPHRVMPSPAATPSSSRSGYWSTVLDTAPSRRYSDSIPPTPATPSSSSSQHLAPDPVAPLDKPYACDTCGTAFKKNSNLVKHIKLVHLGERNFACPEEGCGRLFGQKSNLNSHIKAVHLGEKPFKCSEIDCGRRFSQKSGLKAHTKTVHKGERPYICDDCDASFGHRGDVSSLLLLFFFLKLFYLFILF